MRLNGTGEPIDARSITGLHKCKKPHLLMESMFLVFMNWSCLYRQIWFVQIVELVCTGLMMPTDLSALFCSITEMDLLGLFVMAAMFDMETCREICIVSCRQITNFAFRAKQ